MAPVDGRPSPGGFASLTSPTKRKPLRATVRMRRCSSPLSPTALRTALMQLVSVDSETIPSAPDPFDHVILADDTLAVSQQIDQQIKDLRSKRDLVGTARQLAPVDVECAISK